MNKNKLSNVCKTYKKKVLTGAQNLRVRKKFLDIMTLQSRSRENICQSLCIYKPPDCTDGNSLINPMMDMGVDKIDLDEQNLDEQNLDEQNLDEESYFDDVYSNCTSSDSEFGDADDYFLDDIEKNEKFRSDIIKWCLENNINHAVFKKLVEIINERFEKEILLPKDPRTLLKTDRNVAIVPIADGEYYWHNGLEFCLNSLFSNLSKPMTISLNISMDGLPIFKSSKEEFWPILFNIAELPKISPMVIGIYSGKSKVSNLDGFLTPMVNELIPILDEGLIINGYKITVKIRCFIGDSPARAMMKG